MEIPTNEAYLASLTEKLSPKDHELIYKQCEIQSATTPAEIQGFTRAYAVAKDFAANADFDNLTAQTILELVMQLARLTDSIKNKNGYATVPRIFPNGNKAIAPEFIPGQMQKWAQAYVEGSLAPEDAYHVFEDIHPFIDGNGRVGDLLWKIGTKHTTGTWPEELPPDLYGPYANSAPTRLSAFGEVER